MRGNAEIAGKAQATKKASEQTEAAAKTSITIGGDGRVSIKNADPSLLNGTQDAEVEQAFNAPKQEVEKSLAQRDADNDPLAPAYDTASKAVGYRIPRASDPDILEKLQSEDGIRALTSEMGGSKRDADAAIKALKQQRISLPQMRERVAAYRLQKFQAIQKTLQGPLDESQDIQRRNASAGVASEKARKERTDRLTKIVTETDLSETPEAEWSGVIEKSFGEPLSEFEKARVGQKGRKDVAKAFETFANKDADALGQFESAEAAATAFGRSLSDVQRERLIANWKAARGKVLKAERDESFKIEREANNARREVRMAQNADLRARAEARLERREKRLLTDAEKKERSGAVNRILKQIDKNNAEIIKNVREFRMKADDTEKPLTAAQKKYLMDRTNELKANNQRLAAELPQHGVKLKNQPKPQAEYVTQAEYDALIKGGETAESLARENIRLRK